MDSSPRERTLLLDLIRRIGIDFSNTFEKVLFSSHENCVLLSLRKLVFFDVFFARRFGAPSMNTGWVSKTASKIVFLCFVTCLKH